MSDQLSVLVIGASGITGNSACEALAERHHVIRAGRSSGDVQVDVTDPASIEAAFEAAGPLDGVIIALGKASFAPLAEHGAAPLDDSIHHLGITNKLMGQLNLAYVARDRLKDNGSITLTTGILNHHPVPGSVSPAMVNGALDAFVTAAAMEMPRGIRLNAVSPNVVTESLPKYGPFFPGSKSVPAADVGLAYSRCVETLIRGQILRVGW